MEIHKKNLFLQQTYYNKNSINLESIALELGF